MLKINELHFSCIDTEFSLKERKKCFEYLMTKCKYQNKIDPARNILNEPDSEGITVCHVAVIHLKDDIVKEFLEMEADFNFRDDNGNTPLHKLACVDRTEELQYSRTLELLLNSPLIDRNPRNMDKKTPWDQSSFFSKELKRLSGPNNIQDRPLSSKLIDSLIAKDTDEMQSFLKTMTDNGDKIANQYLGSQTLLHHIIEFSNAKYIQQFIDLGCSTWLKNIQNELPIQAALESGNVEVVKVLLANMKREQRKLYVDLSEYSFKYLNILITSGKNTGVSTAIDYTRCLKRILEKDILIDVNQHDDNKSPLQIASIQNHQEAIKMLLNRGAYIGVKRNKDSEGIVGAIAYETIDSALNKFVIDHPNKNYSSTDVVHSDFTLQVDYSFLIEPANSKRKKETQSNNKNKSSFEVAKTVLDLTEIKTHQSCLQHPVLDALLDSKWNSLSSIILFNALFTTLFIVFVLIQCILKNRNLAYPSENIELAITILTYAITLFTVPLVIREVTQCTTNFKLYYKRIDNYIEWFVLVSSLVICYAPLSSTDIPHITAWTTLVAS